MSSLQPKTFRAGAVEPRPAPPVFRPQPGMRPTQPSNKYPNLPQSPVQPKSFRAGAVEPRPAPPVFRPQPGMRPTQPSDKYPILPKLPVQSKCFRAEAVEPRPAPPVFHPQTGTSSAKPLSKYPDLQQWPVQPRTFRTAVTGSYIAQHSVRIPQTNVAIQRMKRTKTVDDPTISTGIVGINIEGTRFNLATATSARKDLPELPTVNLMNASKLQVDETFVEHTPSLYSPHSNSYSTIRSSALADKSFDIVSTTGLERKQERTKYIFRMNEIDTLASQYKEIVIHCNNGRSRTPLIAALYSAISRSITYREALLEIVESYRSQRSNLMQMLGVDIELLKEHLINKDDEWLRAHVKMYLLAEEVSRDLREAKCDIDTMYGMASGEGPSEMIVSQKEVIDIEEDNLNRGVMATVSAVNNNNNNDLSVPGLPRQNTKAQDAQVGMGSIAARTRSKLTLTNEKMNKLLEGLPGYF